MRMSADEFEMLTPSEFIYSYLGWSEHQNQLQRQSWEVARWQSWLGIIMQQKKDDRLPMTELLPLPWEISSEAPELVITESERLKRANELAKFLKKQ